MPAAARTQSANSRSSFPHSPSVAARRRWLGPGEAEMICVQTLGLLVERAGVDHGLDAAITAEYNQEITHHGRLALFIELNDVLLHQLG